MGYTQYYSVRGWDTPEWQRAWDQLVKDVPRIVDYAGVPISGPTKYPDIVTPILADTKEGIHINGVGDDAFEDFLIHKPGDWNFCKTGRRQYDDVVTCILLRAYMLAPKNFELSSDGFWDEWGPARSLYQKLWPEETIECPFDKDIENGES